MSPNGEFLVCNTTDSKIFGIDITERSDGEKYSLYGSYTLPTMVSFNLPQPNNFAVYDQKSLGVYNSSIRDKDRNLKRLRVDYKDGITSCAFSPNGDLIAFALRDKLEIYDVYHLDTDGLIFSHVLEGVTQQALLFSNASDRIICAGQNNSIFLMRFDDLSSKDSVNILVDHTQPVTHLALSSDGSKLLSGSKDTTIRIWSLPNNTSISYITLDATILSLTFSPDNKTILAKTRTINKFNHFTLFQSDNLTTSRRVLLGDNETQVIDVKFDPHDNAKLIGVKQHEIFKYSCEKQFSKNFKLFTSKTSC